MRHNEGIIVRQGVQELVGKTALLSLVDEERSTSLSIRGIVWTHIQPREDCAPRSGVALGDYVSNSCSRKLNVRRSEMISGI